MYALCLQLAAQSKSKDTFLTGGVIAVNDDRMIAVKLPHELIDDLLVETVGRLVYLKDVAIGEQLRRIDGERYH